MREGRRGDGLRGLRIGALALCVVLPGAAAGCGPPARSAPAGEGVSLFAVGDTGEEPGPLGGTPRQEAVARAMVAADRAAPVDAVVLLGDNFYPDGLREREFKDRLRANVVRPWCHFLAFTARGEGSMAADCPVAADARHPVPLLAVLGNHDYGERESPLLQHKRIPEYLADWHLPDTEDVADVYELPGGLSVVLLQSQEIVEGASTQPLVDALRRARGPWRVVAAHHPIVHSGDGFAPDYARAARAALAEAGVPVHLFLAGHAHSLQVAAPDAGAGRPLTVVAGGGYEARALESPAPDRLAARASPGFARVGVVEAPGGPRLEVTLLAVSDPLGGPPRAEPVARFAVAPDGRFRALGPERGEDGRD